MGEVLLAVATVWFFGCFISYAALTEFADIDEKKAVGAAVLWPITWVAIGLKSIKDIWRE